MNENKQPTHNAASLRAAAKKKPTNAKQPDPCLTCTLPASKCKGACAKAQRKENGGKGK